MTTREAYARGLYEGTEIECHIGVEIREGDDVDDMMHDIQEIAWLATTIHGGNHAKVVEDAEVRLKIRWPDRAYFIETEEDGRGVQVYQPFGMPRSKPRCEIEGCLVWHGPQ